MNDQDPVQFQPPPPPPPQQQPQYLAPQTIYPPVQAQYTPSQSEQGASLPSGCRYGCAAIGGCTLLIGVLVAVLIMGGVVTVGNFFGDIGRVVGSVFSPGPATAQIIGTQTIVTSVQPLGQLVSVSTQLAQADIYVGIGQGALNACGFGANHVSQGAIEAGIDMLQITDSDVQYNPTTDTYTITVPSPQLTSCRVDYIRQYDRSTTVCAVDWDEARLLAQYTSLTQFRDDAIEGGILDRAESEARVVLTNFISALTGRNVVINFRPREANVLPASCNPDVPQGWRFDPATLQWVQG